MATALDVHVVPLVPVLQYEFWVIRDESSNNTDGFLLLLLTKPASLLLRSRPGPEPDPELSRGSTSLLAKVGGGVFWTEIQHDNYNSDGSFKHELLKPNALIRGQASKPWLTLACADVQSLLLY